MSNDQDPVAGIFGQRFDAAGAPLGGEFHVNTCTPGNQAAPEVAAEASGRFTVVWQSYAQDGSNWGVFGQRYERSGALRAAEFRVNAYTPQLQDAPSIAADASGNLLVTSRDGRDFMPSDIFAQRFGGLVPAGLAVDEAAGPMSDGNLIFERGESVRVAPAWRNVTGVSQTVSGTASAFAGPGTSGNPVYTITDAAATYGLLANGATASCAAGGPANVTTREQMAVFVLVANEGAGDAPPACSPPNVFADVPADSPFCRWIEELARRDVVSGCGDGNYCPATLVPPPCADPTRFLDVPASSPFCTWIEELARRGVVSGCGGDNYCPASPVTREQMGVFIGLTFGLTLYGP